MLGSSWLGPIYDLDRRLVARARWLYLARVALLLVLLASLMLAQYTASQLPTSGFLQQQAQTGAQFFGAIIGVALITAFLIGPTAITGSICQERARGAFDLFLATELSSWEIVWGKLGARLWPVLGTMAVALPVVAIASLMGGVDPELLFGSFLVCCSLAVFASALALCFAIRTTKAHEALLATYGILFLLYVFIPFLLVLIELFSRGRATRSIGWLLRINPIRTSLNAGEADNDFGIEAGYPWFDQAICIASLLGPSLLLTFWTTVRLRRIVTTTKVRKQKPERPTPAKTLARNERLLDLDPVYFRECRRRRPSLAMRGVWVGFVLVSLTSAIGGIVGLVRADTQGSVDQTFAMVAVLLTLVGFLILAAVVPNSLAEERAQGGLDVLVATPLTAREIVRGKWRANYRLVLRLAIVPVLMSLLATAILRPFVQPLRRLTPVVAANGAVNYQITQVLPAGVGSLLPIATRSVDGSDLCNAAMLSLTAAGPGTLSGHLGNLALQAERSEKQARAATLALAETLAHPIAVSGSSVWTNVFEPSSEPVNQLTLSSAVVLTPPPAPPYIAHDNSPPRALARLGMSLTFILWFLSWGALLVSLGLLMATLFKRPGWATTVNVLLVVAATIVLVLIPAFGDEQEIDSWGDALYSVGPLTGPVVLNFAIAQTGNPDRPAWTMLMPGGLTTSAVIAILAYGIYLLSIHRLDHSLGRAEKQKRQRPTPASV